MTKTLHMALFLTAGLTTAPAQERIMIERLGNLPPLHIPAEFEGQTFDFVTTKMAFDGAVVKGAPYSADAITESSQTLADGNRIRRTTKASFYRDGEGRTRHEQTLGEIGPLTASGEPIQTIVISDPVAGTTYMMNSREKIARKMPGRGDIMTKMQAEAIEAKARHEKEVTRTESFSTSSYSITVNRRKGGPAEGDQGNVKKESLGTQLFEGVAAEGTRITMTIPAGAVGNERPIEVVTERWYSNQLHTTVMTKTMDPRIGETIYTLKNIRLDEPAHTLFEVPSDYKVR